MKENNHYANFKLRFLAMANDGLLLLFPHLLFWAYLAGSPTLEIFVYRTFLYLILLFVPYFILSFLYTSVLTTYLGGTIGKILTGLRVVGANGRYLNFKRSLFRQTIGYQFSALILGLGFWSIAKDEKKQGWHDKTVGSRVVVEKNLWPLALVTLILLVLVNAYLLTTMAGAFRNRPWEQSAPSFNAQPVEPATSDLLPAI